MENELDLKLNKNYEVDNFDELMNELQSQLLSYSLKDYTNMKDGYKVAKEDHAELAKLSKAINDRRLALEKEYMQPFNVGKDQTKKMITLIDNTNKEIDAFLKECDKKYKEEKKVLIDEAIKKAIEKSNYEYTYDDFYEDRLLNRSVSIDGLEFEVSKKILNFEATKKLISYSVKDKEDQEYVFYLWKFVGQDIQKALELFDNITKYKDEAIKAPDTETTTLIITGHDNDIKDIINYAKMKVIVNGK